MIKRSIMTQALNNIEVCSKLWLGEKIDVVTQIPFIHYDTRKILTMELMMIILVISFYQLQVHHNPYNDQFPLDNYNMRYWQSQNKLLSLRSCIDGDLSLVLNQSYHPQKTKKQKLVIFKWILRFAIFQRNNFAMWYSWNFGLSVTGYLFP